MPKAKNTLPVGSSSSYHSLIIGLLFVILLGTLGLIGILVTQKTDTAGAIVDAGACRDFVKAAEDEAEIECNELREQDQRSAVSQVPSRQGTIGFDYPHGWSTQTVTSPTERVTWRANVVKGYIASCNECDGPFIDISMQVGSLTDPAITAQPTFNDYLLTIYAEGGAFSEIEIQQPTGNDRRYVVTGKLDGLYTGDFETIYYVGTNTWASVFYVDQDSNESATNDGWSIVKDSLNFDGIK